MTIDFSSPKKYTTGSSRHPPLIPWTFSLQYHRQLLITLQNPLPSCTLLIRKVTTESSRPPPLVPPTFSLQHHPQLLRRPQNPLPSCTLLVRKVTTESSRPTPLVPSTFSLQHHPQLLKRLQNSCHPAPYSYQKLPQKHLDPLPSFHQRCHSSTIDSAHKASISPAILHPTRTKRCCSGVIEIEI